MSVLEIVLLAITALAGASIVWSTLTLGISPMPSSKKACLAMMKLLDETGFEKGNDPIIELGSGWGNLLIPLAKRYPHRSIVGYEMSVVPWLISLILIKSLAIKNIKVHRQNYLEADLSCTSVIFCYLFPGGMKALEDKLKTDNGNLKYLISNNFSLLSLKPIKIVQLDDLYKSPVYLYSLKTLGE